MKAMFYEQDYILALENWRDIQELFEDRLEAPLLGEGGKDLGKVLVLDFGTDREVGETGIDLSYEPQNLESWEEIREIKVLINSEAYNEMKFHGRVETRYDGTNKIEITYPLKED